MMTTTCWILWIPTGTRCRAAALALLPAAPAPAGSVRAIQRTAATVSQRRASEARRPSRRPEVAWLAPTHRFIAIQSQLVKQCVTETGYDQPLMSTAKHRTQRRAQREQTRQQILEAADAFLREHPFRELSLEFVMSQTNLTRTAFYRHFEDVPALVLQLLAEVGGELYGIAEQWAARADTDFAAAAHEGLANIVDFFERHGPLVQAVVDAAATDEHVERGYGAFVTAFDGLIVRGLDAMVERGELPQTDTRALARALNLMNERYLLDTFGHRPYGDAATARATLELIWLRVAGSREPESGTILTG